jgi:hypothetical protein
MTLLAPERAALEPLTPEAHDLLLQRLADIKSDIVRLKLPGAYANALYVLQQHPKFVQARPSAARPGGAGASPTAGTPRLSTCLTV